MKIDRKELLRKGNTRDDVEKVDDDLVGVKRKPRSGETKFGFVSPEWRLEVIANDVVRFCAERFARVIAHVGEVVEGDATFSTSMP